MSEGGLWTGLWATSDDGDLGWGLSVHQRDGTIVAVLYAYDAQGAPRWLIGSRSDIQADTNVVDLSLQRVRGFCRGCEPIVPVLSDAGTLRLVLSDRTLAADVHGVMDDDGFVWQRSGVILERVISSN